MVVPGVSGCLRRWGTQGLSPDELSIESTFLQELIMGPLLERKEQMVTQHSSEPNKGWLHIGNQFTVT